jgi:hypothetical protein
VRWYAANEIDRSRVLKADAEIARLQFVLNAFRDALSDIAIGAGGGRRVLKKENMRQRALDALTEERNHSRTLQDEPREAPPRSSKLTVVQMYVANARQPGSWIRRWSWENTCALVKLVGDITGPPPYYGNPKVWADYYDLTTGELKNKDTPVSSPNTYGYHRMDPPPWAR